MRNNHAHKDIDMLCGSGRYSIHLSTWERSYHHHHYRHLRKTEITDDERVAFYVYKSDEETRSGGPGI